jgi:hypothetical protein
VQEETYAGSNDLGTVSVLSSAGPKTRSYIETKKNKLLLKRGLNLISVSASGQASLLENFDACKTSSGTEMAPARDFALKSSADIAALFIVVHDSGICSDDSLTVSVNGKSAAFEKISFRAPYVARLAPDGELQSQYLGERYSKLGLQVSN